MSKKKKYLIGVDLGGTKILTALLDQRFRVRASDKSKVEAEKGQRYFIETIIDNIKAVLRDRRLTLKDISTIGVGCPGVVDTLNGIITMSPNLTFLNRCSLRSKLQSRLKVPVYIENDVNAGLYGEYQFGAARGYRDIAGFFLGTGVGGALILNGELYRGVSGAAGEMGHTFISVPSFIPGSAERGTVEGMIGRLAISSEAGWLALKQKAPHLLKEVGFDIKKIKSKSLARSIRAGDKAIQELVTGKARLLGVALASVVNLLNPGLIVLGGGLVEAMGHWIVPVAAKTMRHYALPPSARTVKVVPAQLKDHSVTKGAAKIAYDSCFGKKGGKIN